MDNKITKFEHMSKQHVAKQEKNPFANKDAEKLTKSQISEDEYGRPVKGSKSERRGLQADQHVCREVLELCHIIHEFGTPLNADPKDPRMVISFGELFNIYVTISNKLVGMLLRARKHQIVDFEGEMLFQRRDDNVPIILLKSIPEVQDIFNHRIDETQEVIKSREKGKHQS